MGAIILLLTLGIIAGLIIGWPFLVANLTKRSPFLSTWALSLSYLVFLPMFVLWAAQTWFIAPFVFGIGLILFAITFDTMLANDYKSYHKNILAIYLINFVVTCYSIFHGANLIFYKNNGTLHEPNYDIWSYVIPLGLFLIFGISWLYRSFYFKSYKLFIEFILGMALAIALVYFVLPNAGMIKYKLLGQNHVQIDYENLP